jgi:hypothetical protein
MVVRGIARYQSLQGHLVDVAGEGKPFSTSPAGSRLISSAKELANISGQVIHIHSLRSLLYQDTELDRVVPWLSFLKDRKVCIALTLFNEDLPLVGTFVSKAQLLKLLDLCSPVFVCGSGFSELICERRNCRLIPIPVDCELVSRPQPVEPSNRPLKALFVNYLSEPTYQDWLKELCQFSGSRLSLALTVINSSDIASLPGFIKALKETDIVIEDVSHGSYGVVGAHALLHGRTVVAGAAVDSSRSELQLSPVIGTTRDGLENKLLSLMREPRSLRDLIKRGRNFVEQFHRAETIVGIMVDDYLNALK